VGVIHATLALTWAQRLKRVFGIDIETCRECGGAIKVMRVKLKLCRFSFLSGKSQTSKTDAE